MYVMRPYLQPNPVGEFHTPCSAQGPSSQCQYGQGFHPTSITRARNNDIAMPQVPTSTPHKPNTPRRRAIPCLVPQPHHRKLRQMAVPRPHAMHGQAHHPARNHVLVMHHRANNWLPRCSSLRHVTGPRVDTAAQQCGVRLGRATATM